MTQVIGYLKAQFDADVANFIRDVGKAAGSMEQTQKRIEHAVEGMRETFDHLAESFLIYEAAEKLWDAFKDGVKVAGEAEAAQKKLAKVIENTGSTSGVTVGQVDELTESLSRLSGKSPEVIKGAETILASFKNISAKTFPEATKAAMDLAIGMNTDLSSAAKALGKALENPTAGMKALQKAGVILSDQQKASIKDFMAHNDIIDAQGVILDAVKSKWDGMTEVMRDSIPGALTALNTSFEELWKTIGEAGATDLLRTGIEVLTQLFQDMTDAVKASTPAIKQWFNEMRTDAEVFLQTWGPVIDAFAQMGDTFNEVAKKYALFRKAIGGVDIFSSPGDIAKAGAAFVNGVSSEQKKAWDELNKIDTQALEGKEAPSKKIGKWWDDLTTKLDELHKKAAASGYNTGADITGSLADGLSDAKAEKKLQASIDKLEKQALGKIKAPSADAFVNDLMGRKTEGERGGKANEDQATKDAAARGKAAESLDKLLSGMDAEIDKKKILATQDGNAIIQMEAKEKLQGLYTEGTAAYNDALAKTVEVLKEQHQYDSQAAWDAKIASQKESNAALQAQLEGKTKEYDLDQKLLQIKKDPYLSDEQKQKEYDAITAQADATQKLNDQIDAQKKAFDAAASGTGSYTDKIKALNDAVANGTIKDMTQLGKVMQDLQTKQIAGVTKGVSDFANQTLTGMEKAIESGGKLSDVFKNMGIQLGNLAAKKLLIDPLSNAIGNFAGKLYGGTGFSAPGSQGGQAAQGAGLLSGVSGWLRGLFGGGSSAPGVAKNPIGNGTNASASGTNYGLLPGGGLAAGLMGNPNATGGGDKLSLITDSLVAIRGTLDFCKITTAGGLALRVWEAPASLAGGAAKNAPATNKSTPFPQSQSGGTNIDLGALVPLISSLVGTSKAGPAWKVINPDCPCDTGGGSPASASGGSGGVFGGDFGVAPTIPGQYGFNPDGTPFVPGIPANAGKSNANPSTPYTTAYAGLGGPGSDPTRTLSVQETQAALQQAANKANATAASQYAQGLISAQQVLQTSASYQNSQLTLGAAGYRASAAQAYGPAIQSPFIMQSPSYAGGGLPVQVNEGSASTPGLTGGISKSSMYAPYNNGDFSTQSGSLGPYAGLDANPATAYLWGSGGSGITSGMDNRILDNQAPQYNGYGYQTNGNAVNPYDFVPNGNTSPFGGAYAQGGDPPVGRASLVGERGPELFVPRQSGTVLPNDRLKEIMGGASASPVVHLHDYTSTQSQLSGPHIDSSGASHFTLTDLVAQAQSEPKVQRAQRRYSGTNARGVRRG